MTEGIKDDSTCQLPACFTSKSPGLLRCQTRTFSAQVAMRQSPDHRGIATSLTIDSLVAVEVRNWSRQQVGLETSGITIVAETVAVESEQGG